ALIVGAIAAAAAGGLAYEVSNAVQGNWPWEDPEAWILGHLKGELGGLGSVISAAPGAPTIQHKPPDEDAAPLAPLFPQRRASRPSKRNSRARQAGLLAAAVRVASSRAQPARVCFRSRTRRWAAVCLRPCSSGVVPARRPSRWVVKRWEAKVAVVPVATTRWTPRSRRTDRPGARSSRARERISGSVSRPQRLPCCQWWDNLAL